MDADEPYHRPFATSEVPVLHPFTYQSCLCNFQHTPGHRNAAPHGGKYLDRSLSTICPVPTCALTSSPWIQLNSWHDPGIIPQSGLCAATFFWGLPWFISMNAGWFIPLDFKVLRHLSSFASLSHHVFFSVPVSYPVEPAISNLSYCNRPLFALSPSHFKSLLLVRITSVLRSELILSLSSGHKALCSYQGLFHRAQSMCWATALASLSLSLM